MLLRFNPESESDAFEQGRQRACKKKTDICQPGESFDFIGFEFGGEKVLIRQETLGKVKSRIEQFTQRSKTRIQAAIDREDFNWGAILLDEDEEHAIASVRYVQQAIQRINALLGFTLDGLPSSGNWTCKNYKFNPGLGYPWNVLKCVSYEDVREQFEILDQYAYLRLQKLAGGFDAVGVSLVGKKNFNNPAFKFPGNSGRRDLRAMGLMTFKDVYNRFPK